MDATSAAAIAEPPVAETPLPDSPLEEVRREVAEATAEDFQEQRREAAPARSEFRQATPAAVVAAIDDVSRVITSLREALDAMEEVLETLELAEVQKHADEREIESLRRSLRQLHRGGEPQSVRQHRGPERGSRAGKPPAGPASAT